MLEKIRDYLMERIHKQKTTTTIFWEYLSINSEETGMNQGRICNLHTKMEWWMKVDVSDGSSNTSCTLGYKDLELPVVGFVRHSMLPCSCNL